MANEKRLIDANSLLATMKEMYCDGCKNYNGVRCRACDFDSCMSDIEDAPTVDAVEVVRCGNCKHFREPFCMRRDDETHRERINMLTVDFCSYGERRDNG